MILHRLLLALIAGLLVASPASALTLAVKQVLGPPGWVLPYNPNLQFDFARGTAWKGTGTGGGAVVPPESLLTVTRATPALIDDLNGQWRSFPAATLARSTKGATVWLARTNLALWSRDLTNAAWAKVTMTAALTATGIDGTANAATTITATGASSTILQTVVQASTADTVSFFVRRRTGTGTIEVTANGVAFTDITTALATAATATPGGWYRAIVSATLVNPVLGLRITTSGDAVDVDLTQLEAGTFATSPILTTTIAVARAADVVSMAIPSPALGAFYSLFATGIPQANDTFAVNQTLWSIDDGTTANFAIVRRFATTSLFRAQINSSSVAQYAQSGAAWAQSTFGRAALLVQVTGAVGYFNGTANTAGGTISLPVTPTQFTVGTEAAASHWAGYIGIVAVWRSAVPVGFLARVTGSSGP